MTPTELRSVAKPNLPPDRYIDLLEQASGAVPHRSKSRPLRDRPMRPFRCSACGVIVFVTRETGSPDDFVTKDGPNAAVVTADGGRIPECPRYHSGFIWNSTTCEDHNGKCASCPKCNSRRWTCCQMAESSIGCRRKAHDWRESEVPSAESHAEKVPSAEGSKKRRRLLRA
eukprot:TRINITY_DN24359_c0_g1_i1.p1 TRINITY_DN24359_c0_g1~~TRINITY_DN24359_c0_g1_i1.p1  ORF type:complete len:171 (-),score=27.89 TRINITY_DN24359_c0_g1_i1:134-646(-)